MASLSIQAGDCSEDQEPLLEDTDLISSRAETRGVAVRSSPCFPHRYRLFVMVMSGFALHMAVRANFNIALVAMVNTTESQSLSNASEADRCPGVEPFNSSEPRTEGEFPWSGSAQSQLLSGFYYGYTVLQIPGGYITERWGSRRVIALCMAMAAAVNLLTPLCARYSYALLLVSRVVLGFATGPVYVAMISMWSKWAPKPEIALLVGGSASGLIVGQILSFSTSGVLCHSQFLGGWPSVFYIYGSIVAVWTILWWLVVSDSPHTAKTISVEERKYIEENTNQRDTQIYRNPPFFRMVTSPAILCFWLAMTTDGFGFYVIFNAGAIYMKEILGYDIQADGVMVGLQYAGSLLMSFIVCPLSDVIIRRGYLSTKNVRRVSTAVGEVGLASALLLIALVFECNAQAVTALLVGGQFIYSFVGAGFVVNAIDIAPMYAGTVTGVGNTLAQIMGFIVPQMVNQLTGENPGRREWSLVFVITSGVMTFGVVVYWLCVQGEELPWARPRPSQDNHDDDGPEAEDADANANANKTNCATENNADHCHRP